MAETDTLNSVTEGFSVIFSTRCQCNGSYTMTQGPSEWAGSFAAINKKTAALWRKQAWSSAIQGYRNRMICSQVRDTTTSVIRKKKYYMDVQSVSKNLWKGLSQVVARVTVVICDFMLVNEQVKEMCWRKVPIHYTSWLIIAWQELCRNNWQVNVFCFSVVFSSLNTEVHFSRSYL